MRDSTVKLTCTPVERDEAAVEKLCSLGFSVDGITTASVCNYNNSLAEAAGHLPELGQLRRFQMRKEDERMTYERANAEVVASPPLIYLGPLLLGLLLNRGFPVLFLPGGFRRVLGWPLFSGGAYPYSLYCREG